MRREYPLDFGTNFSRGRRNYGHKTRWHGLVPSVAAHLSQRPVALWKNFFRRDQPIERRTDALLILVAQGSLQVGLALAWILA